MTQLEQIINPVSSFLTDVGFVKRGKHDFVRKYKDDFDRIEKLSFTSRRHREDKNVIYVGCMVGIYYPNVRKVEKTFIKDHLSDYPIIAGSVSHFSDSKEYLSVIYKEGVNDKEVIDKIIFEIEHGGFNLLNTFPDLKSIYLGILHQHPYLYSYYNVYNERLLLTFASITYLTAGKDETKLFLEENIQNLENKIQFIQQLENLS